MPATPRAIATTIPPPIRSSLPPMPPRRRWRRRLRCVILNFALHSLREGPDMHACSFRAHAKSVLPRLARLGLRVFGREVVDDAVDQHLVGDDDGAAVAGVDVGV